MNILIAVDSVVLRAAITEYLKYRVPRAVVHADPAAMDMTHGYDIAVVDPDFYSPVSLLTGVSKIFTTNKPLSGRMLLRACRASETPQRPGKILGEGEREVMRHLLSGRSNKEIAALTGLSVSSVKLYVRRLCQKMGARNRTQLAMMAREV